MEISITKRGDLQIIHVKGKIRLQSWRILDKHLESLLLKGHRWVALDLGDVSLICSTGIGSILHNVRKFQGHECTLMLVSTSDYVQELFALFGCHAVIDDVFFSNWGALEKRMQSQGLAVTE